MTEKPSVGLSMLAALLALGGLPVGLGLFMVMVQRGESDGVVQAWQEGGLAMYGVLALGALATLVSSVGAFLAPRRSFVGLGVAQVLTVAVMGVCAVGYWSGANSMFQAIAFASPRDRAVIMRGGLGELDSLVVLAASVVAGVLLLQGAALLVCAAATRAAEAKRGLLLAGLGVGALGVWQVFTALTASAERDVFMAMAHASAMDQLTLLLDAFSRIASHRSMALAPLGAALLVAVGGAVSLRSQPRAMAGVLFAVLVPLAGVGGLRAMARPSSEMQAFVTTSASTPALMPLDATAMDPRDFRGATFGTELHGEDGASMKLEPGQVDGLAVGLEQGVKGAAVLQLMKELQRAEAKSVTLVGQKVTEAPSFVPEAWRFVFAQQASLTFELTTESACSGCEYVEVTPAGLVVGGETWPLQTSSFGYTSPEQPKVNVKVAGLTFEQVLSVGHTCVPKSLRVALVFPD